MSKLDEQLAALDIYCDGGCHMPYVSSHYTFVRHRRPVDPVDGYFFPGAAAGKRVGVTVFGRDGKPVWQFAEGDEVHSVEAFIAELDKRLPQLEPKEGAD